MWISFPQLSKIEKNFSCEKVSTPGRCWYKKSETGTQKSSYEKVFWKYAANLQENTQFVIEIALRHGCSPVKKFSEHLFLGTPLGAASEKSTCLRVCANWTIYWLNHNTIKVKNFYLFFVFVNLTAPTAQSMPSFLIYFCWKFNQIPEEKVVSLLFLITRHAVKQQILPVFM